MKNLPAWINLAINLPAWAWQRIALYGERKRHQAWADEQLVEALSEHALFNGEIGTEAQRLAWIEHLLSIGANPNALTKANDPQFAIKKEVGRYPVIRRRQNALSLAVCYPSCFKVLVEAGARIDRRVLETMVYVSNWNQYRMRQHPSRKWNMRNVASSIQIMFNHHAPACLHREYLDLSDMKIKPAYEILAALYPPARSFVQAEKLDVDTPQAQGTDAPRRL